MEDKSLELISQETIEETSKKLGNINILICGKTGVGKSTLINAIFGSEYANVGQGKPVTQNIEKIHINDSPLNLYDSRGLECKDYEKILEDLKDFLNSKRNTNDISEQIHLAWICIDENSRRVETAEKELGKLLKEKEVPYIVVITKVIYDNGFSDVVCKEMNILKKNIVRVRALKQKVDGTNHEYPIFGLQDLINLTYELIPEATKNAFVAAQKVDLKFKLIKCQAAIGVGAAAAAACGAVPIPFSDCILLIPVQVAMLSIISILFNMKLEKGFYGSLISSVIGCPASIFGGRKLAYKLIRFFKVIPGVNLIADVITGATAATLTTTLGEVYMGVLAYLTKDGKIPTTDEILKEFKKRFNERV